VAEAFALDFSDPRLSCWRQVGPSPGPSIRGPGNLVSFWSVHRDQNLSFPLIKRVAALRGQHVSTCTFSIPSSN
jgi:hypothetical protein